METIRAYESRVHRDLNASMNMLERGRAGLARTDARGGDRLYDAKGIASSVEGPRTYPAIEGEARTL